MVERFLKRLIRTNRNLIYAEARHANGFLILLMKQRNTGIRWTSEERVALKGYIKRLAAYVPVLMLFLLPFGTLLIPVLAEVLDRRNGRRCDGGEPLAGKIGMAAIESAPVSCRTSR